MNRHTRALAGVLAMAAMTFSFTESVMASTCARMSDPAMPGTTQTSSEDASAPSMECLFMAGHDGSGQDDGRGHCPFGLAAGQGCSAAASLPALNSIESVETARATTAVGSDDVRPDLLLARALFHPPRA
jgi:hypothetical protein